MHCNLSACFPEGYSKGSSTVVKTLSYLATPNPSLNPAIKWTYKPTQAPKVQNFLRFRLDFPIPSTYIMLNITYIYVQQNIFK